MFATVIIIIAFILIVVTFLVMKENYIMSLGDYGKPNPKECNETEPDNGICNACTLRCGIHEYKKNCETCSTHI